MRIMPLLQAVCLSLTLSACVAPLLMMSPTSQLMWALLKPLVGFDPNEVNLFEQPLIKDRMTDILGPNYDSTMQLLKTANELQQEGPLFYVVSRYAPVPDVAKQAGMVWNSQTNQLSVLLQKGDGTTQAFGENLADTAPLWPTTMQGWQNPDSQVIPAANALTGSAPFSLGNALSTVISGTTSKLAEEATQAATNGVNNAAKSATAAVTTPAKQTVSSTTATVTQEAAKAVAAPAKQAVSSAAATVTQEATKAIAAPAKQAVSSAAATVTQEATKAIAAPAKQAVSSAAATVTQEATKAIAAPAKQAVSSASAASHTAGESIADAARAAEAKARAKAEAEMEALLK
jgi:chemotaxis protein histidine kinase CheA